MTSVERRDDNHSTRNREKCEARIWQTSSCTLKMKRWALREDGFCNAETRRTFFPPLFAHKTSANTNEGMPKRPPESGPVDDTQYAGPRERGKTGDAGVEARLSMSDLSLPRACLAWRDDRAPGFQFKIRQPLNRGVRIPTESALPCCRAAVPLL